MAWTIPMFPVPATEVMFPEDTAMSVGRLPFLHETHTSSYCLMTLIV
jgi:hypothetical protein